VPNVAAVSDDVFMRSSGWLGSQVVSVLGSGAEGPGFKSQLGNSFRQTVHTHRASVHQAAKLVAALLSSGVMLEMEVGIRKRAWQRA